MSETGMRIAAWLLTYALHSTVLLAAAALLTARWVRGEAWRETLWKAALVGGVLTATVQSTGWIIGDLGRWNLAVLPAAGTAPASPRPASPAAAARAGDPPSAAASTDPARPVAPLGEEAAPSSPPPASPSAPAPVRAPGTPLGWALLAWMLGAGAMLLRLALRQWRLRSLLAGRSAVTDGAVLAMLARLRRDAGLWRPVRLTVCAATPTPLALGGGEICVPPRFLTGLDPEQQRSALAHELAHLARRDPAWHFGVSILEALFFFQPLNRVARVRLRESAEFLCDAWAARQTGSPLGLARCLAEVASWVAPGRHPIPAGTMAMAEGGSPLVRRVQRLTSWRGEPREGSGWLRIGAAALLVAAVAAIAPAVASTDRARGGNPSAGAALPSPRVVDADGQEIVVIRHPDVSQPLASRWEWAVEQIGERGMERAWIAYSVPTRLEPGDAWFTDTDELSLSSFNLSPLNPLVGAPAEHALLFFAVARGGEVKRIAGRQGVGMEVGGGAVVWLGPAAGAESFAQLRRLADGLGDADLREGFTALIGIHPGDQTVPYLAAVLGRDGSSGVRSEAAQALGRHPTPEALEALRTAVRRDGSDDVRREAVEAIGRMGTPASAAVLRDLALRASNHDVRRTAAEALGHAVDADVMETLTAIALADRDVEVARAAVESMEHAVDGLAGPALVRMAWSGRDARVAGQAAESLGRLPAPSAVASLDSIARRHPDPFVAQQAVEALGGFADAVSGAYIRRIARTHPDPRVREEARDQLARGDADHDAGSDPEPDPDRDVELDPGVDPDPDPDPSSRRPDAAAALDASATVQANATVGARATP
jgi:HEAT repeat protein/beta-lactamase regulating signal transducer with metallopeptidase domain